MASRGVNKVILVGNLGNAPDVKYTQAGAAITTISVATSESWKDKDGNQQERTEWHRVKAFGRLAEIMGEYLTKGRQVYIEGSLRTEKYTDKNGVEKYSTDIIADQMQMLGSNGKGGGERAGSTGGGAQRSTGGGGGGGGDRGGSGGNGGRGNDRQAEAPRGSGGGYGARTSGNANQAQRSEEHAFDDSDIPFGASA